MNELIDLTKLQSWIQSKWRASLGIIVALVLGILIGILSVEWRVIDDCKYLKSFRFGNMAFNCVRTI
jgi:ABC-type nitrate/sulfonate/bicarbonate transport system permease component